MMAVVLYNVGSGFLLVGLVAAVTFTVLYGLSAPWWRSPVGRMFFAGALAEVIGVGTHVILLATTQDPDTLLLWQQIPRAAGYGAFMVAIGWQLVTFLYERHAGAIAEPKTSLPMFWVVRRLFRPRDHRE